MQCNLREGRRLFALGLAEQCLLPSESSECFKGDDDDDDDSGDRPLFVLT